MAEHKEVALIDAHGVSVHTRWWASADARGLVLISHGASEHSGRYDRFAQALNVAGFSVAALDHRGHGGTARESGTGVMGPGGGEALLDDLHELRNWATGELHGDVPVFVFGHSMGALIALAYLTRHASGLAGAVLCGFPADPDNIMAPAPLLEQAIDAGMRDEPFGSLSQNNGPFEPARTDFDWLSRDSDEVDAYIDDSMCGDNNPLTFGYLVELLAVVSPARDAIGAITCPVLVIAGDQDSAAGMGTFPQALADALIGAGVTTDAKLYEGARHELLNETNRDEVTADVTAWFAAHA